MKASEKILLEQSGIAIAELPETLSESCNRVWRAFYLDRQYQEIMEALKAEELRQKGGE